jgi:hypothetical protein
MASNVILKSKGAYNKTKIFTGNHIPIGRKE